MSKRIGVAAALFVASACIQASTLLTATLTNGQENPPAVPKSDNGSARPASFGTATFVLNDAMTSMSFQAIVNNIDFTGTQSPDLNDNLLAAHLHAGPAVAPGVNGPVVWGFFGNPFNDSNPNDVVLTPFASGIGGTISGKWDEPEGNATTLSAQLPNILAGRSYINFHTQQFPGGEIRGQILPIPEPHTYALLLAGLGTVLLARMRQRR